MIYLLIFILTAADIIFTSMGLTIGVIEEANPLMNYFIQLSLPATMISVLVLVGLALLLLHRMRYSIKWLPVTLLGITVIKVLTLMLHLRWILAIYD